MYMLPRYILNELKPEELDVLILKYKKEGNYFVVKLLEMIKAEKLNSMEYKKYLDEIS